MLYGLGRRSNRAGFEQIAAMLALQGVRCHPVVMPPHVQHLLGWLQIVAPDLALVRRCPQADALLPMLAADGLDVVLIEDDAEVVERQALNFVTIAPRTIVMAQDAPGFRRRLARHGIEVADVVPVSQYRSAAGGLACATGIIGRDLVVA